MSRGRIIIAILLAASLALAAADLWLDRHGHFAIEQTVAFYTLFALGSVALIAVLGWIARAVLGRREGYYDP